MEFEGFVEIETASKKARKPKIEKRGCEWCPLNTVKGIKKIMPTIAGKDILIVAQSPGPEENEAGRELVGRSGQFLWDELEAVDIRRKHCDVMNAVKCFPADRTVGSYDAFLKMRNPSTAEIKCCTIHTEEAMKEVTAQHILVLGQVAAKAFLNTRSVPQQKIFYSEPHKAMIYLADHPAFFIRGYGAAERLAAFRGTLAQLAANWQKRELTTDSYAFLKKQDYRLVLNAKQARHAWNELKWDALNQGRRLATDIEWDVIDGVPTVFAVGFCARPGKTFIFVTGHPAQSKVCADAVRPYVHSLVTSERVRKSFHYGCSDVMALEAMDGIKVKGFDWDTLFANYLYYPDAKAYGLDVIGEREFQEFSGYANIVVKDLMANLDEGLEVPNAIQTARPDVQMKWLYKTKQYRLSRLSLETLRLYNGGDCHLTKLIDLSTKKLVPKPLVHLYRDLSFVLKRMEDNGPLFDRWQHKRVERLYPHLEQKLKDEVCEMIGDKDFNPGSPQQVYKAVYEHFELEYPMSKGKPNTKKITMLMMTRQHPFPGKVVAWRKINRARTTYIVGQRRCAKQFGGRLKTTWKATGTRTGRLSSSGGDSGGVNLQNLHGDARLQNMCVADRRWRKVFNVIAKYARRYGVTEAEGPHYEKDGTFVKASLRFRKVSRMVLRWIIRHMPDLYTFLILDYGQVEVRVAAQMSGDKNLLRDCLESDIHTTVGVHMTGWKAEDIANDKKVRTLTKNVHFGILFGITKKNLFEFIKAMDPNFDGTPEEVEAAYDRYFARYPGVQKFIDKQRAIAERDHCVYTMFGLRQPLIIKGFKSKSEDDIDFDSEEFIADVKDDRNASWRNQAVNGPVQGTAHQLMECALVNLYRKPGKYDVLGVPVMEVHDALYMRVKVLELRRASRKAQYLLEKESLNTVKTDFPDINWTVPIVTDAEAGLRLGGKVKLDYEHGVTTGQFMLQWFFKTRGQVRELEAQLAEVENVAA